MRKLIGLCLILICLAACVPEDIPVAQGQGQNAEPSETPIPTAAAAQRTTFTVERGDVVDEFEFVGRWLPRDQIQLSFEVAGNVRSVNIQRGDSVVAGEILADLQIDTLEETLETQLIDLAAAQRDLDDSGGTSGDSVVDAQFNLASANISLQSEIAGAPWTQIADAQTSLEDAERELDNAQRDYDDAVSRPDTAASSVDSAYERLLDAQDGVDRAQRSLYSAQVSYYQYELGLQNTENSVLQAELNLDDAVEGGGNPDLVDAVVRAQLAVDNTREDIAQSTLTAPIDGVVLEVTIQPGDAVESFVGVITIALPEPLEIIANLSFNDTQNLQIGQVGTCQEANNDDLVVQCVVRSIPFTSNEIDQTTRVAATLPELQSGALVDVIMVLEESRDTLFLPPQAVNEFGNRTFVVLQTPEGERVRDVVLGLQTDDRVEILEGVVEGDIVVQQ
ncbi:MAG: HlyD family efflux transporter periplasmic adaptor subunit [Chloroflexota bacterium]